MTDLQTVIRRLESTQEYAARETEQALAASLLLIERDARLLAPRDQRRLSGSINSKILGSGLRKRGEVGPSVAYGFNVEFGRKAGAKMPPVDALVGWVVRHWRPALVDQQRVLGGFERELSGRINNKRRPTRSTPEQQIRRRTFALAKAIQRRGIDPNPYMRPAYFRNRAEIMNEFRQIGRNVTVYIVGGRQ